MKSVFRTLNRPQLIPVFVSCLLLTQWVLAQDEPTPTPPPTPPAEEQPAATPEVPKAEAQTPKPDQAAVEDDTNSTVVIRKRKPRPNQDWEPGGNHIVWRAPLVVIGRDAE